MQRITVWAEPLISGDFEPYYVTIAGVFQCEPRTYPEEIELTLRVLLEKIFAMVGEKPCVLQARTERWTLLANGGYDYRLDWEEEQ